MSAPTDNPRDKPSDEDRELQRLLRRCPTPPPPPQLFERALAHAVRERERERRHARLRIRWLATGFGAAAAAGVVALSLGGFLGGTGLPGTAGRAIPTVTVSLYEPETVRLVFAAETALDDATMTVLLPAGVELEGFPGEREIRWQTSLAEGHNLLPLRLVATAPAGGELLARLEHDSRDRTFRLRIEIG